MLDVTGRIATSAMKHLLSQRLHVSGDALHARVRAVQLSAQPLFAVSYVIAHVQRRLPGTQIRCLSIWRPDKRAILHAEEGAPANACQVQTFTGS